MAQQDKPTFETTFNSAINGLFKDNSTGLIDADDLRTLVRNIKDSFLGIVDNFIDEDSMSSNSASKVPSQQSVKAYIDNIIAALDSGGLAAAIAAAQAEIDAHQGLTNNPHSVTKQQVGLGSVDNTADSVKPVSLLQQEALDTKQDNLVSDTHVKTVQGNSIVGSGDVVLIEDAIVEGVTDKAPSQNIVFEELALKATIAYVDDVASGIVSSWKDAVIVATTANITLSGEQTIDGVLTSTSRVLVKNQDTSSQNGIYVTAAGAWARSSDTNEGAELEGAAVTVQQGTVQANTNWIQQSDNITIDSSSIVWGPLGQNAADASPTVKGVARLYIGTGSNTDGSITQGAITTSLSGKQATLVSGTNIKTINGGSVVGSGDLDITLTGSKQVADYVIEKISTTIYARPRPGSGLTAHSNTDAYTVIQAAITALTPAGAVGTGGGRIHICKGTYSLTDELIITGWEASGGPYSQLVITGDGWSTWLFQATAAKNCLIVKNKASVVLRDFKSTSTQRSALLLDDSGADSEMSTWKSHFDNLILETSSTTHPAVFMKNFMNLTTGFLQIGAPNYHGIIMENDSLTTAYGNSYFGHIKLFVSAAHAGLLVQSTDGVRTIGHCSFGYFEVGRGLYGIRTSYAKDFSFNMVDIEQTTTCISLGTLGAGASNNSYNFTFSGGYLLPLTGGTAINCAQRGFGNRFLNIWIDGDATSIPILDTTQFKNPNIYDVNLGFNITEGNISITESALTYLRTRSNSNYTTRTVVPTKTTFSGIKESIIPTGTINGSNTAFTLPDTPQSGSLKLYSDGIRVKGGGVDYTLSGANITMVIAPSSALIADYRI